MDTTESGAREFYFPSRQATVNSAMKYERLEGDALPIDKSATIFGLDEFSLLSRIQAGEIVVVLAAKHFTATIQKKPLFHTDLSFTVV